MSETVQETIRTDAARARSPVLPLIRAMVKDRLMSSEAFAALDRATQRALAHDTVNALTYIVGGPDGNSVPGAITLGGNAAAFAPSEALAGAATSPQRDARGGVPGTAPVTGASPGARPVRDRSTRPGLG